MPQPKGDPRNGAAYRKAVALCVSNSDICHLCGHGGAKTADHLISVKKWFAMFGNYEGVNAQTNLAPAHGTMGMVENRCPVCHRLCNQSRGARALHHEPQPRSRDW